MSSILQNIEAISACRDRDRLPGHLLRSVVALLGADADVGIFSREAQGEPVLRVFAGPHIMNSAFSLWPALLDEVRHDGQLVSRELEGRYCGAMMLQTSELSLEQAILAFDVDAAHASLRCEAVSSVVRIYGNQIRLLDYSELDTLTRLLNRKTFDETFDRLLLAPPEEDSVESFAERREHHETGAPAWLGVVDVDHFKRINDSFGHLFGDEVLLRMGDLMRRTFRAGDRLFRFGGEEFVVILNAEDAELASASFDRFRDSVENHEFPQVGKVTCSIGFTSVTAMDAPSDVVGRADKALYYAKENGRNRVCCHEALLAEGAIAQSSPVSAAVTDDFDIDALFN